jgi:O-antigen/teichoic acid export membrane protein
VYSIAATATGIGLVLPQALSVAVMPRAAALEGATREGEIDAGEADLSDIRTSRHTLLLLPVSALVVALLLAVGVPVLYGDAFEDSIRLGFILLPGVLALGLGRVFFAIVIGRGRPRYPLYTVLITVPPTVAGYLLVIPDHGATGAAIVSCASYLLTAVITFAFFRHLTGIGARRAFIPERADLRAYPEVLALSLDYARSLARLLAPRRR